MSFGASVALLVVGLFNASMLLSEKGFFGMAFVLSLLLLLLRKRNIRDVVALEGEEGFKAPMKPKKADDQPVDL